MVNILIKSSRKTGAMERGEACLHRSGEGAETRRRRRRPCFQGAQAKNYFRLRKGGEAPIMRQSVHKRLSRKSSIPVAK